MLTPTTRTRNMLIGAIGTIILFGLVAIGVKASFGAFDGGYRLRGTFASAGQGLLPGSDVKIRGVNVGEVKGIELVDNRALITLRINDGVSVPVDAAAVIRPKTLFGEKFVDIDPGATETAGPFLGPGGELTNTLGGFELEQVLADLYPVVEAIDPVELAVVLDELANAGAGLGENINRSIVNGAVLTELQASNDAEVRQFLGDVALLSEELDRLSPALVGAARDLSVALPTITENADDLAVALDQLGRLSGDLADLVGNNKDFIDVANTLGSDSVQTLFDHRDELVPLLDAAVGYVQAQVDVIRIEVGDGTLMAAVKGIISPSGLLSAPPPVDLPVAGGSVAGAHTPLAPVIAQVARGLAALPLGGDATASSGPAPSLLDALLGGDR